jgi:lipid-A-disaccharide synthase
MKYFLIAGEASGDLHGANLIAAIKQKDPSAIFNYWGGDRMQAQAPGLLNHYKDVTIMGFVEVLLNLNKIFSNLRLCKAQIDAFNPDVVVLIDYPGFNLRIAEYCKSIGIRVVYYIAPKVWAWKENRAKKLEKFVDDLLIIFPFEVDYFKKWKIKTHFVGNPLCDEIAQYKFTTRFKENNKIDERPIIALLPGSRKQEIKRMLPVMIEATKQLTSYQLVIAGAPGISESFYKPWLSNRLHLVFNQTYDLLKNSDAAIVCSGTATLETALLLVPQVCVYAGHPLSYFIAKQLVKVKYISLVNLCMDKPAIKELIQFDVTAEKMRKELNMVLPGGLKNSSLLNDYDTLQKLIGGTGASLRAAEIIVQVPF